MLYTLDILCVILTGSASILSMVGAFIIGLSYVKLPSVRNFTRRLLLYLAIADFVTASGNLVAAVNYASTTSDFDSSHLSFSGNCSLQNNTELNTSMLCIGQSFATTFSNMASFLWTLIIAVHIWSSVVVRSTRTEAYGLHVLYLVICWLLPFGLTLAALTSDVLGQDRCYGTGVWCGIRSDLSRDVIAKWMYAVDVAWQLPSYVLGLVFYLYTELYIRRHYRTIPMAIITDNLRNEDKYFLFSLLIIYCLKIWGILRFFITTYTERSTIADSQWLQTFLQVLLILDSFGVSGQGFFNCILFCYHDKQVRDGLRQLCCSGGHAAGQALIKPRDIQTEDDVRGIVDRGNAYGSCETQK